ncbi:hypothetical protein DRP53_01080 [candidate division WOR-3 bacterium]|uniref:Isochorismatase-like domain-containing protein n=1 Tax=candidate division WOR-3 bacterium TaxID=2052148 RepID=A0A660SNJ8_UNCW3|nr:MAG: hypothetical protein DRP53_01080 [candidate division WOR-3 bacterium]
MATEQWLELIGAYNRHRMRLRSKKAVLLVIDMQNFFLDPRSPAFAPDGRKIIPRIRRLIRAFRRIKRPVIYTRHGHHPDRIDVGILGWWWDGMIVEGSEESEICSELKPRRREKVIHKHRYSAFYQTDLELILKGYQAEDLVITGLLTNCCCETTARDAYMRDYRVFFLADATAAANQEFHLASLLNLAYGFAYITTTDEVIKMLQL